MRQRLLNWLVCPQCDGALRLDISLREDDEVLEGILVCTCGERYPVIHGVPRMLSGALVAWLYAYAFRKRALELLRFVAQRLSSRNIRRMAFLCNLVDYGVFINIYRILSRIPVVGRCLVRVAPLRVQEYAQHGYRVAYTDWYDRLSAPITNYYRRDEMQNWLTDSGMENARLEPEGDSWWWLYGERGRSA